MAPALDCLVDLRGASWITISGFTFTETAGGDNLHHDGCEGCGAMFPRQGLRYCGDAVHLKRTEHCRIENNRFYAVGGNAVYLEGENFRNVIQRNEISHAGANGICLLGDKQQHPVFNQVLDNHIHHCGAINKYVAGVFLGLSEGNLVGHNYIHHMPHHAVNLGNSGFGRNFVEYNEIRHTCLETYDNGAINCWMEDPGSTVERDAPRSGHLIRYNLIADTVGCRVDEEGKIVTPTPDSTHGIYLDNCTSNCFVYGNTVVRSGGGTIVQNGKNNVIENNVIVGCRYQHRYVDPVSGWAPQMADFMTGNRFCRNICYATGESFLYFFLPWTDRVIEQSDYNVFFSKGDGGYTIWEASGTVTGSQEISLAEWQKMGYDTHSVTADPLFLDPENDDFTLSPDSPALRLGFQPIDVTQIGIRTEGED